MALHWLDYVLFALVVLGSIAIGLYNAIKGKTPDDTGANSYLMDRHKLSYGPVMLSIVMSFMSSIALISRYVHYIEIFENVQNIYRST